MSSNEVAPITHANGVAAIREFFARMSGNCAAQNFDATEPLFAQDVASFGTKAGVVVGRDLLRAQQSEGIWTNIEDFQMQLDQIKAGASGDLAWGMVPWTSTGFDPDGESFHRPGRATIVLERRDGQWVAVHSHFSLIPGTPASTHGRR